MARGQSVKVSSTPSHRSRAHYIAALYLQHGCGPILEGCRTKYEAIGRRGNMRSRLFRGDTETRTECLLQSSHMSAPS